MRYRVISEYVDLKTGERVQPGSLVFLEPERARRLEEAGCIVPAGDEKSKAARTASGKKRRKE